MEVLCTMSNQMDAETGAFKLATGSATGSDVTLTLELKPNHALTFYQVKLIDAGRFGGTLKFGSSKLISISGEWWS